MSSDVSMSDAKFPLLSKITSLADRSSNKDDSKNNEDEPKDGESDMSWKNEDDMKPAEDDKDPSDDVKMDAWSTVAWLHAEFLLGELAPEDLPALMQWGHLIGSNKAEILVIQYWDYNNVYCKQANEEWTLNTYMNKYPKDVQLLIKQFPAKMDDSSLLPHRAALCALDRWSTKEYLSYEQLLYIQPKATNDQLVKLAKDIWISDLDECLDETNTTLYLQQEVKSAKKLFALKSLPTYIFLNKESGEWVMVPGLYENEEVLPVLDYLLKK